MALSTQRLRNLAVEYRQKAGRYVAVSVFNVLFGQSLLVLANAGFGWSFKWSNIFAVGVSAGPAYVLSRSWIWQKKGRNHMMKEVVPFWAMAFAGLALSTLFAWYAERLSDATVVLMVANLSAFGLLWVAKFVILDQLMFVNRDEPLTDDPLDALVDEVFGHHEAHRTHREAHEARRDHHGAHRTHAEAHRDHHEAHPAKPEQGAEPGSG